MFFLSLPWEKQCRKIESINEMSLCTTELHPPHPPHPPLPPFPLLSSVPWCQCSEKTCRHCIELQETLQACRTVTLYTDFSSGWPNMSSCLLQQLKAKKYLNPLPSCPICVVPHRTPREVLVGKVQFEKQPFTAAAPTAPSSREEG